MNGKSVEVENPDAEGRLALAGRRFNKSTVIQTDLIPDALHYAIATWRPKTIVDVATLTGAVDTALGQVFSAVFTVSKLPFSNVLH
jgi:cytosol aminopeptidase